MNKDELFELRRALFAVTLVSSRRNWHRATGWAGALAVALSTLSALLVANAGGPAWAVFLTGAVVGYGLMSWLCLAAWRRYEQRKWNSLEA